MKFSIDKAIGILKEKLETWLESITSMLPNLVVAILVFIAFYFLAGFAKKIAKNLLDRISDKRSLNNLFGTFINLLIIGIGFMIALNILNLDQAVTSLLAGAGIIGLALGFAFQDITANFISGVMIALRKPIQVGDIIETEGHRGVVENIDLRTTIIRTFPGLHVIVPNKDVFQSPIVNYTRTKERRVDLSVGVSYGDDLEKVKKIAKESVADIPFRKKDRDITLFYTEFGGSSINFMLRIWIDFPNEPAFLEAQSEAIIAVKKAFDQNDITIPFPIRTLDFGIKGGATLSEMKINQQTNKGDDNTSGSNDDPGRSSGREEKH